MLRRYHKKVYIPDSDIKKLEDFTNKINDMNWRYSSHALDNIKYRTIDNKALLLHIKALPLDYKEIFEYYASDTGDIIKVCYRVTYTKNIDIILVVGYDKQIITIYINAGDDNHITLKKDLYVRN